MDARESRGALAVMAVLLAVLALTVALAWGTGSWTAPSGAARDRLAAWCSIEPGDAQGALVVALGTPTHARPPGQGRLLALNVTPANLLSLDVAMVPMHRSDGYATWVAHGYLLADTYARDGMVLRMYAWPVRLRGLGHLGCATTRGTPFGSVTVPAVVGLVVPRADAALRLANLVSSADPLSNVTSQTTVVTSQAPTAGSSVTAGSPVRIGFAPYGSAVVVHGSLRILGGGPPGIDAGVPGEVTFTLAGRPRVVHSATATRHGRFELRLAPGTWLVEGTTPNIRPQTPGQCGGAHLTVRVASPSLFISVDCDVP